MQFRILGPVEAADGDRVLVSGAGKPTALLALLLLRANEVASADRLIDDLWGERPPRTAAKSLQTYVVALRRALGDDAIVTRAPGYLLVVEGGALDAETFGRLVASARAAGDARAAAALLRQALALWRGDALAGLAGEPWARAEAERLEESRLLALEARIEADLELGADVAAELEALVRRHPLRERLLMSYMAALYRSGRQADALEAYRAGRRRLVDELGIEPMPELRSLEQRILRHDPALAAPVAPRGGPRPRPRLRLALAAAVVAVAAAAVLVVELGGGAASSDLAAANSLVQLGSAGRPGTQISVGAGPRHAIRALGFVWTSNEIDGTVSRIDPAGRNVETIPVGANPEGIAFAGGDVWVAESGNARVVAIDPRAGKVVSSVAVGNGPTELVARGDGLWVANSVDGTLSTVDARAGRLIRTVPVGQQPSAVAVSADAVWVALAGSGSVAELDRAGRRVIDTVNVGDEPAALAVDGASVWVANQQDGTVMRIRAATGSVDASVPVGGSPNGLAVANRKVWVTLGDGRVAQIESRTARLIRETDVGGAPTAVLANGPGAWITTLAALASHRGGTLRVSVVSAFDCSCQDPVAAAPEGWSLLDLVYDGLVAYRHVGGPGGNAVVPDLARAVPRPRDGGRTYVFRLRQGVRFSNGRVVRASDVSASFHRLFAIKHLDFWDVPLYADLSGVGSCVPGGRCDLSRGIIADDRAGTVTFHLDTPDPDFLYELTLPFAFVVPAETSSRSLVARSPPGTGAYRLESYAAGRLVLARNPRFEVFAPDAAPDGFPDRIVATIGAPQAAQLAAVERGASDAISSVILPSGALARLARLRSSQLHADPLGETEYVFLNTQVPPFESLAARRAVNEAVDRSHLVAQLGGPAAAAPTCQVLPPDFPGYRPYCPFGLHPSTAGTWSGPNVARALRLVSASGTRGARVLVWAPRDHAAIATYFAALLRQLGYRAATRLVATPHRYYALVGDPRVRAQIGWAGWIKDYSSPADFLKPLFSCSGIAAADPAQTSNFSLLCDPRLDAAMADAGRLQQQDPVAGQQAWTAIDRTIVDRAGAVPYANDLTLTLLSRRTGDYQFNPEWGVLFDQLWVR